MSWIMNYINYINLVVAIPTEESNQDILPGICGQNDNCVTQEPTFEEAGCTSYSSWRRIHDGRPKWQGQGSRSWFPLAHRWGTEMYDPNNLCLLWNKMKSARQEWNGCSGDVLLDFRPNMERAVDATATLETHRNLYTFLSTRTVVCTSNILTSY